MVHQIQVTFPASSPSFSWGWAHSCLSGHYIVSSFPICLSMEHTGPSSTPFWGIRDVMGTESGLEQPLQLRIRKLSWAGDVLSSCALWAPSHLPHPPPPHQPQRKPASPPFLTAPRALMGWTATEGTPEAQEPGLAHRCDVFGPSSVSKK